MCETNWRTEMNNTDEWASAVDPMYTTMLSGLEKRFEVHNDVLRFETWFEVESWCVWTKLASKHPNTVPSCISLKTTKGTAGSLHSVRLLFRETDFGSVNPQWRRSLTIDDSLWPWNMFCGHGTWFWGVCTVFLTGLSQVEDYNCIIIKSTWQVDKHNHYNCTTTNKETDLGSVDAYVSRGFFNVNAWTRIFLLPRQEYMQRNLAMHLGVEMRWNIDACVFLILRLEKMSKLNWVRGDRELRLLAVCSKHPSHSCVLTTTYSMQGKKTQLQV